MTQGLQAPSTAFYRSLLGVPDSTLLHLLVQVRAERELEPENAGMEKRHFQEAYEPSKEDAKLKTLDEYEKEGHKV